MSIFFYLTLGIAAIAGVGFAFITRGIFYHTPNTDNEIMTYAAAQSGKWRWFSDMHGYGMKTYMKDVNVILIAILQRILGDKESDHPYITLGGLAISASTVLIYLLGADYWGPTVGFLVSILYLFCFWTWQTALYGGHANVAGMLFLLAVYFVHGSSVNTFTFILLAGISICCMIFSSGSASKLLGPFFTSLFYAQHSGQIRSLDYSGLYSSLPFHSLLTLDLILTGLYVVSLCVIFLAYRKVVAVMYSDKCPSFLRGIINNQANFSLQHYINHAGKKITDYSKIAVKFLAPALFIINVISVDYLLPFFSGFILMFFILTMPRPKENVSKFLYYAFHNQSKKHFRHYIGYFARRGISVHRNTRGAGWPWVPKLLGRFMPWHFALFLASFALILFIRLRQNQGDLLALDIAVMLVAALPLLWAEFTKAAQASRIYVPAFAPSLLFVGYAFSVFSVSGYFIPLATGFTVLTVGWNLWKFFNETYPARMGALFMAKTLKRLNIKDIYTYKSPYNESMVYTMPGIKDSPYVPRRKTAPLFNVHYINSVAEVTDGWIVVPNTNGFALTMDDDPEAINGNFRFTKDEILNKLLDTKKIETVAKAKFKTYGTSRAWSSECEVLSYLDLILNEITENALYRGHAWLLHSGKLAAQS